MTKDKASDMVERMRNTATREKPIRVGDEDKRRVKELPRDPGERVRVSLDLSKEQHKALKRFALEAETDASAVLRALLVRLEADQALADEIQAELSK